MKPTAQQENKTHLCLKHLEEDSSLKGQNFDPFSVMNHGLCDVASQNSPHLLIQKEASVRCGVAQRNIFIGFYFQREICNCFGSL